MSQFPKRSVVVPVDFSTESLEAVDVALDLVDEPAHLRVVHVLRDVSTAELEEMWEQPDQQDAHDQAHQMLREKLSDAKYQGIEFEVIFGDPGESITDCASRHAAELIVIPSHGRTGLKRLLIGSVAERVVRLSHCPVLVLRK